MIAIANLHINSSKYVMFCAIWYHLFNLKNVKNTHGGVLFLVKLNASACNFTICNTPPWVLLRFLNCTKGTKSRKTSHMKILPSTNLNRRVATESSLSKNMDTRNVSYVVPMYLCSKANLMYQKSSIHLTKGMTF